MISVEISNRQAEFPIDTESVREVVTAVLRGEDVQRAEISVAIVNDAEMHALNRRFLHHDYPTDVLSFVLEHRPESLEGEVVISAETAGIRATEEGWSVLEELTLYLIHGTLHLAGYDDKSSDTRAMMRQRERFYLSRLGLAHSSSKHEQSGSDLCAGSCQGDNR